MIDVSPVQLMAKSYQLAATSVDPSTQNAALIVNRSGDIIASGINHPVAGVQPRDWQQFREDKLRLFQHAERSAIFQAAREGKPLEGQIMICSWAACIDCAKAIIESGLKVLVTHSPRMALDSGEWLNSIQQANQMLTDAGVTLFEFPDKIPGAPCIRHRGKLWNPDTFDY